MGKIEMNKGHLIQAIIQSLNCDHQSLLRAARAAHNATTDSENSPDNKYETLALESSYIAQGQANRASEIRKALDLYRSLPVKNFTAEDRVYLTALVAIESNQGYRRSFFSGRLLAV